MIRAANGAANVACQDYGDVPTFDNRNTPWGTVISAMTSQHAFLDLIRGRVLKFRSASSTRQGS